MFYLYHPNATHRLSSDPKVLASGKLPLDALIDGTDVLLDGLLPAMERLAAGEIPAKVMVVPEVGVGATIGEGG